MNTGQAASTGAVIVAFLEGVVRPLLTPAPVFSCPVAAECPPCPACELHCGVPAFQLIAAPGEVRVLNECDPQLVPRSWYDLFVGFSSFLSLPERQWRWRRPPRRAGRSGAARGQGTCI